MLATYGCLSYAYMLGCCLNRALFVCVHVGAGCQRPSRSSFAIYIIIYLFYAIIPKFLSLFLPDHSFFLSLSLGLWQVPAVSL